MNPLAPVVVKLIRELSQARRERDLAIQLLCEVRRTISDLELNRYREQRRQEEYDRAMLLLAQDYERRTHDVLETAA